MEIKSGVFLKQAGWLSLACGRIVVKKAVVVEMAVWLWHADSNRVLAHICKLGCSQPLLSHVR